MNTFRQLDAQLKEQAPGGRTSPEPSAYSYAMCMAEIENVIAVVSDLTAGTSRIYCGAFASVLGIDGYTGENSIWERKILERMTDAEREAKFIAELRFLHALRKLPPARRHHCLHARLRMTDRNGNLTDVLHRMYYIYDNSGNSIRYAICLYGPLPYGFNGKSVMIDTMTGTAEELTSGSDNDILSARERQILTLIGSGMKSADIAAHLSISKHTVSRHRQAILSKLHVKNSMEACRIARSMSLIL